MKISPQHILYYGARWVVGLVFVFACLSKIVDPNGFAQDVDNYRILPYFLVALISVILPWLELFCGLGLIVGKYIRGSSLLLTTMLVVFLIAIISAMARGLDITCGCFGVGEEGARVGLLRLVEDVVLLATTLWVLIRATRSAG